MVIGILIFPDFPTSLRTWKRQNTKHQTPNAEKPEIFDFLVFRASSKSYEN